MRYVVTGATSGLGRNVAKRLCRDGHEVIALGRDQRRGDALASLGADFHMADLQDQEAMDSAFRGADAVFHCAARSSPWGLYRDFYAANVTGTENVLSAMRKGGVKVLIHVSTPSVYFNFTDRLDIREDAPLPRKFVNAYAATKKIAEDRVLTACHDNDLRATIFRPRAIIGPYDANILPRILTVARRGSMPLLRSGRALVDITYVDNLVDAMMAALQPGPHQSGRIYNISNGEPILLRRLIEQALSAVGVSARFRNIPYPLAAFGAACLETLHGCLPERPEPILTRYSAGTLAFSQTLNIDAARADLGYEPKVDLNEGIRRAAAWWMDNADRV